MAIRMTMALDDSYWKVRPVRSAIPMVAVKPGSIPTMIPRKVAQKTENRIAGVINPQSAFTRSTTPKKDLLLWQRNQKDFSKHEIYGSGNNQ